MSTSPHAPKGEGLAGQSTGSVSSVRAGSSPIMTLLKGIGWLAVISGAIAGLVMYYDVIWDLLAEAVPLVLEVIEESLDTFFESVVKLNPGFAQMATAYTGFVLFLIVFYLLSRKAIKVYYKARAKKNELTEIYTSAWRDWSDAIKEAFWRWWNSLDLVNKAVAITAFVLLGIPLALLVSVLLGSLVAELL